jgi:uncharacterized damage-inducible protein DinB
MDVRDLLEELFDRVVEHVHGIADGLTTDDLTFAPADGANTIGWLLWHLTRVQDHHVAELLDHEQVWSAGEWATRFSLPPGAPDTGYGHTPEQVRAVRPESAAAVIEYFDAVDARTRELLSSLTAADLDRIVDERWDPPVSLGVRLISIADDDIQHAGQAAYVKGVLPRR